MKHIFLFMIAATFSIATFSQVPNAFKYQAVVRDNSGNILANRSVAFRISIIQGNISGMAIYSELHSKTTNDYGLVDLEIGKGTSPSGLFTSINWGISDYFIKVEMDPAGGTAYLTMGTSQLLSVPYALIAKKVESISTDATLTGAGSSAAPLKIAQQSASSGQVLKWNGSIWSPSDDLIGSGGFNLPYSGNISTENDAFSITNKYSTAISGKAVSTSLVSYGVYGESASTPGAGIYGVGNSKTGQNYGVLGASSSPEGIGVRGFSGYKSGTTYGVIGEVSSTSGFSGYFTNGKFYVSGNTGIGTESPSARLHVNYNSTMELPQLLLDENDADFARLMFKNSYTPSKNWTIAGATNLLNSNSKLNFYYWNGFSGKDIVSINGDGNVGVGTSDPHATLDVQGTVKLGSEGKIFSEIREISGTTSLNPGNSHIAFPPGYDKWNIRILMVEIKVGDAWVPLSWDDLKIFSYSMDQDIWLTYPSNEYWRNAPFRMIVMKVN